MSYAVVIPALNPPARIIGLVEELMSRGLNRIVVVDDGSTAQHRVRFERLQQHGCLVAHHEHNLGKGTAIKTGIRLCAEYFGDVDGVVCVDCDGQHLPNDVSLVVRTAEREPEALVIGVRELHKAGVPLRSRIGAMLSSLAFWVDTGLYCADTQTGLRVIPRSLWERALATEGNRYEWEMRLLTQVAKEGPALEMVPIKAVFLKDSASHFDTVQDTLSVYGSFLRFATTSLSCTAIDLILFAILSSRLPLFEAQRIFAATALARVVSSSLNFALNRRWSFRADEGARKSQMPRFFTLVIAQMSLSAFLVNHLSDLPLPLVGIKMMVDLGLFFVSYFVQRNWVFAQDKPKQKTTPDERPWKFAVSSLVSAAVDLVLFTLALHSLPIGEPLIVAVATALARVVSGTVNFLIDRTWIFDSRGIGNTERQFGRFFIIFLGKMSVSAVVVTLLHFMPDHIPTELLKVVTDVALFLASYPLERDWAFARR